MARKNVSASVVREFAREAGMPVGTRGRIHPDVIAAFRKANKGLDYVAASEAEKPTVTVKVKVLDSAGRASTRPVTVTTEHARDLLGHPKGRRGRLPLDTLALALEAERLA